MLKSTRILVIICLGIKNHTISNLGNVTDVIMYPYFNCLSIYINQIPKCYF